MSTYTLPSALSAPLTPEVAAYICKYTPTTLTADQWSDLCVSIREMAASTEPVSPADANKVLGALSGLTAWAISIGNPVSLGTALTPPLVERHTQNFEGKITDGQRTNTRGLLRRALRVRAGEPPRSKREARQTGPAPYRDSELRKLLQAAADSSSLQFALGLALTRGLVVPAAHEAAPLTETELSILGRWTNEDCSNVATATTQPNADVTQGTPFTDKHWQSARRAAQAAEVPLLADRLRATWLHQQLARVEPLVMVARPCACHGRTWRTASATCLFRAPSGHRRCCAADPHRQHPQAGRSESLSGLRAV